MSRRGVSIFLAAALTSLLFAVVTTSGGIGLWIAPEFDPTPRERAPVQVSEAPAQPEPEPELEEPDGSTLELPNWLTEILNVVAVAVVIVGIIALVRQGWKNQPKLRLGRRPTGPTEYDVLPDVAAAVVDEATAQREALMSGAPRNAIVRCWHRLERDVAAAGLRRRPSDTSAEFTERVLAEYSVESGAIRELAALYREARFSEHPIDEPARRAALDALDQLHRELVGEAKDSSAQGDAR